MDYTIQTIKDSLGARRNSCNPAPAGLIFKGYTMKLIKLTQDRWAMVDDEDYGWLNQYKWHAIKMGNSYYAHRYIGGGRKNPKYISMHREIMQHCGIFSGYFDHINHNGIDNRKINIRACSQSQNMQNQRIRKGGTSQFKGVYWSRRDRKWYSRISFNGIRIHLGCFDDEKEAALTYDRKAIEWFGEYACTNFSKKVDK